MTRAGLVEFVSVERYLADELRSQVKREYNGGYVYPTAETRNIHNIVAGTLLGIMYTALRGRPCQSFNSNTKVRIRLSTHTRFYYPDAMVVCDPNPADDTFQDRPVVLAEVASSATRRIDEGEKRDAYLSIPELSTYLLIETVSPRVVAYHRTERGFVPRLYEGLEAVVPLDAIDAMLALADLYERVDFSTAREDDLEDTAGVDGT